MSIEVTKIYKDHFPAARFIGKRYTMGDNPTVFAQKWGEWMNNGWFTSLEEICLAEYDYLGLMTFSDMSGSDFTYWIGMFAESNTPVPDGYLAYDLPESDIAVAWVKGKEPEIYGKDEIVIKKFQEAELSKLRFDINGGGVSLERYNCPRFTTPDADGNVTLDYCYYIE